MVFLNYFYDFDWAIFNSFLYVYQAGYIPLKSPFLLVKSH